MVPDIEERKQRNIDFWEGNKQDRPLCIMRLGEVFFSREFKANHDLLIKEKEITPDMIHVADYLPDYERMYQELDQVDMDGIFSADPMTGFPWNEGAFGARICGTPQSFVSHPVLSDVEELEDLSFDPQNAWYQKYLEFAEAASRIGNGRFTAGQPILRGVTDTIGSLIGQTELIWATMEEHDLMVKSFSRVVEAQRWLIDEMYRRIKPVYGGYSCGFYHIWAPGKIMWYQEDLSALLSPVQYEEYLYDTANAFIEGYDYTLVHLHPASFFNLDHMLKVKNLKVIQVNKDVGGPTVRQMVPQLLKIIESGKRVLIGLAKLDQDDIDAAFDCLPSHSVGLNLMADDVQEAKEIMDYVAQKTKARKGR